MENIRNDKNCNDCKLFGKCSYHTFLFDTSKCRHKILFRLEDWIEEYGLPEQKKPEPTDEDCINAIKEQLNENGFKTD